MFSRIRTLAFLLSFSLPCSALAEVKIDPSCRVKNQPPGRCGWCAVETLARHHKIKILYGITEKNATRTDPDDLEEALTKLGVSYRVQHPGTFTRTILQDAIKRNLGAVIGFRELYPGAGGHIVTLVDFGPNEVRVIDSNDEDRRTRTMSLERFLFWWDGFALVLEKKSSSTAKK
jgi:ABC-type bacteriocin/lantibiotic exporter with double-glycine peptidase domain